MELHNSIFIKRSLSIPAMISLINVNYLRLLDTNSQGQAIGWYVNIDKERYERYWFISLIFEILLRLWKCCQTFVKHLYFIWVWNPQANQAECSLSLFGRERYIYSIFQYFLCWPLQKFSRTEGKIKFSFSFKLLDIHLVIFWNDERKWKYLVFL